MVGERRVRSCGDRGTLLPLSSRCLFEPRNSRGAGGCEAGEAR
jgi:hypothetical protein